MGAESASLIADAGAESRDFDQRWESAQGQDLLLDVAALCEAHPELLLLSSHLLAFCHAPSPFPSSEVP